MTLAYKDAGVDIEAGNALVRKIAPLAKATKRAGVMGSIGGFGGLFDLKACGYTDPVLVSGTDGVGTKLRLAIESGIHHTVGVDLVAMCVNDLIVQGAEPLFFLDYFATGALSVDVAESVISGIAEGCKLAGCALIGGETAEMPGMYGEGDYDLAGFCVGAVEREDILPVPDVKAGDVLLGLASSGVHSNGYSLVRHILLHSEVNMNDAASFDPSRSYVEHFMTPTRIYIASCLAAIRSGGVKALAHITGGGLTENLPRVLPEGVGAEVNLAAWKRPALFQWLQEQGNVADDEMLRTFNCGIGMVLAVEASQAERLSGLLKNAGETVYNLGSLVASSDEHRVHYTGQ